MVGGLGWQLHLRLSLSYNEDPSETKQNMFDPWGCLATILPRWCGCPNSSYVRGLSMLWRFLVVVPVDPQSMLFFMPCCSTGTGTSNFLCSTPASALPRNSVCWALASAPPLNSVCRMPSPPAAAMAPWNQPAPCLICLRQPSSRASWTRFSRLTYLMMTLCRLPILPGPIWCSNIPAMGKIKKRITDACFNNFSSPDIRLQIRLLLLSVRSSIFTSQKSWFPCNFEPKCCWMVIIAPCYIGIGQMPARRDSFAPERQLRAGKAARTMVS